MTGSKYETCQKSVTFSAFFCGKVPPEHLLVTVFIPTDSWAFHRFVIDLCVCVYVCVSKVPKTCEGQQTSENNRSLPDVVGTKKQISYRTEIIGGVPIVTQTQVKQNTAWISGPGVSRSLTTCVSHIVSALLICTFNCVIVVRKPLQLQEPKKPLPPGEPPPPALFLMCWVLTRK